MSGLSDNAEVVCLKLSEGCVIFPATTPACVIGSVTDWARDLNGTMPSGWLSLNVALFGPVPVGVEVAVDL